MQCLVRYSVRVGTPRHVAAAVVRTPASDCTSLMWTHNTVQCRGYMRGGATPDGTQSFVRARGAHGQFMQLPRAQGLQVSRLGWGGDSVGRPVNVRYRALWRAVRDGSCNVVHFNLDDVNERLQRYDDDGSAAGALHASDDVPLPEGDGDTDELGSRADDPSAPLVKAPGSASSTGRTGRPVDELAEAVIWESHALTRLFESGVSREEVVVVARLSLPASLAVDEVAATVAHRAEAGLDGLGLEMADVLIVEVPPADQGFGAEHMAELLECLDVECQPLSPLVGMEADASDDDGSADDLPLAQFYGISCPRFSVDGPEPNSQPLQPVLSAGQQCLAVEFAWNAFDTWPITPSANGDSPLDLMRKSGVWTLARKPLDTMLDGRPFRCVDAVPNEQVSGWVRSWKATATDAPSCTMCMW